MSESIGKVLFILFFLQQSAEAMMRFMPTDQLVATSEYIVVARVQTVSDTGKSIRWGAGVGRVIKNELQVIELIKGALSPEKPFILNTLKFDGWMEDNVELPSKGSNVLLFFTRDEKGELKPVNGIQGVWYMKNGEFTRIGHGTTLKQIREMVQNQQNACTSRAFTSLLDSAEMQTQSSY
jgi:hypothetical protein